MDVCYTIRREEKFGVLLILKFSNCFDDYYVLLTLRVL